MIFPVVLQRICILQAEASVILDNPRATNTSASSLIDKVASNIAQVVDKKQVKYWLQFLVDF
jgi:hypothetical protein